MTVLSGSGETGSYGGMTTPDCRSVTAQRVRATGGRMLNRGQVQRATRDCVSHSSSCAAVARLWCGSCMPSPPLPLAAHRARPSSPSSPVSPSRLFSPTPSCLLSACVASIVAVGQTLNQGKQAAGGRQGASAAWLTRQALGLWQEHVGGAHQPEAHRGVLDDAVVQAAQGVGDKQLARGSAGGEEREGVLRPRAR